MPYKKGSKRQVSMYLDAELVEMLDAAAEKADITRHKLMENLLKVSLEELMTVDKLGLFKFSLILRDMHEGLKAWAEGILREPEDLQAGIITSGR